MTFTSKLPTEPGLYRHRWDFKGELREQTLFVGYTNASAPKMQGTEPNAYMPRTLKCCPPDEHLHADRLTPAEWGGWWERVAEETSSSRCVHPKDARSLTNRCLICDQQVIEQE